MYIYALLNSPYHNTIWCSLLSSPCHNITMPCDNPLGSLQFSQAYYPLIWPEKMAPAQSTLRPASLPFLDINNTSFSSSVPQTLPFNNETWVAFGLMLERSRASSRERLLLARRQQVLGWVAGAGPRKGLPTKKLSGNLGLRPISIIEIESFGEILINLIPKLEKFRQSPKFFDAIVTIYNSIGHTGQDATAKNVSQTYYGVTRGEIVLLIKLCEICHWKAPSKSKGPLKPIISTKRLKESKSVLLIWDQLPTLHPTVRISERSRYHGINNKSMDLRLWCLGHLAVW